MSSRLARWRWPLAAAAALLGVAIGLLVALVGPADRRAQAAVIVSSQSGAAPAAHLLPSLRELATSSVLAGNVRSTLRLRESEESVRRRLRASVRPGTDVIAISATASTGDRARQIAQEAATVFTQLVAARFGPGVTATLFDAAHVTADGNRHVARDVLYGGVLGLCAGLFGAALLGATRPAGPVAADERARRLLEREQLLERRIKAVGERERAVARRAGEFAAREQQPAVPEPPAAPPAAPPLPPAARVDAAPPAEPEPAVPAAEVEGLPLNVDALERLVAASDASADRRDEWQTYLFFLREHAGPDGTLPPAFEGLVVDVFGDVARARPR